MFYRRWGQIGLLLVGVFLLIGSLVGTGMLLAHSGADDRIEVRGTVIDTDPVRIDTGVAPLTVVNAESVTDEPLAEGDIVDLYGTVEQPRTVRAIGLVQYRPWEFYYMYGVSVLAALWVLVRIGRGWEFDTEALGFAPRSTDANRDDD